MLTCSCSGSFVGALVHGFSLACLPLACAHLQSASPLCVCPKHHHPRTAWHPPVHGHVHVDFGFKLTTLAGAVSHEIGPAEVSCRPDTAMHALMGDGGNQFGTLQTARSTHVNRCTTFYIGTHLVQ